MNEDFKKWLCELTGLAYTNNLFLDNSMTELLVDAMWAINRNKLNRTFLDYKGGTGYRVVETNGMGRAINFKHFHHKDYNNSEQESLKVALEYIFEQDKKIRCDTCLNNDKGCYNYDRGFNCYEAKETINA